MFSKTIKFFNVYVYTKKIDFFGMVFKMLKRHMHLKRVCSMFSTYLNIWS